MQDRLGLAGNGYNVAITLNFAADPDLAVLATAVEFVVRRHPTLRTSLRDRDGEPWQHVLPSQAVEVSRHVMPAAERTVFAEVERGRPIDLEAGRLLRAALIESPDQAPVLLLVIHHIAFDGWSAQILLDELAAAYRAGGVPQLRSLTHTYTDYARLQRSTPACAEDLAYWTGRLRGIETLRLPYDRLPTSRTPERAASLPIHLTPAIRRRLEALAREADSSLFVVLLAAWQVYLHHAASVDRVCVGVPVAGRDDAALEPLVGLFVNLLVIDADFSGSPDFLAVLRQVRDTVLAAMEHRALPFDELAQSVPHDRSAGRSPFFNVAFALQSAPAAPDFGPELDCGAADLQSGIRFDLELYLWRDGDGVCGTLIADADCFDIDSVAAIRQAFLVLLARLVSSPGLPVRQHDLLAPDERQRILRDAAPPPREIAALRIEQRFAAQAAQTPECAAVIDADGSMSYRELDRLAGCIAGGLSRAGVRPGCTVALLADRSSTAVAALLAILRCGAAYLPLDPQLPLERLTTIMAEARPALLVSERPVCGLASLSLAALAAATAPLPELALPADALAYVIYTSGSTGRPKGIAIPHRAVLRLACNQTYLTLCPGRRVGHLASLAFDAATFELWSPLLSGAALVVLPRAAALDPALLAAAIRQHGIDTLFVTTALFHQLVDLEPAILAQLETLLFGGEACDPRRVRLAMQHPPRRLLHVYGPTESTTFAAWHELTALDAEATEVPIGLPLDNTALYVLDPQGGLVAPGSAGELHIGGDGLAWCYIESPDRTAGSFIPDAISGARGGRLYRTGDRVRLRRDGLIAFLGRNDRQIKIRGFRVEPAEIEAALCRLAEVRDAVVQAGIGSDGAVSLRAYVACPAPTSASYLRAQLCAALPAWMVPAEILVLAHLPLTANGKLDRAVLPKSEPQANPLQQDGSNPLEAEIALLVADILGLPSVAPDDDIFALGGHSLSMTRLVARLRSRFRVELILAPLFQKPNVAAISRAVRDALLADSGQSGLPTIRVEADRRHAPLSFAQGRLWFLDRLGLTGSAYHSPLSLRLRGRLDQPALRSAVAALVARHATLRTVFEEHAGQPRQHILEQAEVPFHFHDVSALAAPARLSALHAAIENASTAAFDLSADPPMRVLLLRLAPDEHILTLVFHHIAFDGWSLPIVARDLSLFYRAAHDGTMPALLPLPVQYADYAVWQRQWLQGARLERLLGWWRERLSGITDLELPTDFARPSVQTHVGGTCRIAWSLPRSREMLDFARAASTTPYIVLLACFTALLHRYTGRDQVVLGAPIANRTREEVQDLVGFFVNSLVLASDCSGDPDFHELLERVRNAALDAYAFQELPFDRLVEALRPQRDLSRHPLFQTVFVLQQSDAMAPCFEFPELAAEILPIGDVPVRFDLEVHLTITPDGLAGYAFFNRSLFRATTIERMLDQYCTLMGNLIAAPDRPISTALLESEEALDALGQWSHA